MAEQAAVKADKPGRTEKVEKQKLSIFNWEGIDKKGKKVQGQVESISVAYVNAMLRRQGVNPTRVRKQQQSLFKRKKKITTKDITVFTRQFATMVQSGIPIVQGIDIVAKGHENPSMQTLLMSVKQDIESGTNLSSALGRHKLYFDSLYCNLVTAGVQAGILDSILQGRHVQGEDGGHQEQDQICLVLSGSGDRGRLHRNGHSVDFRDPVV
jgi:type IV pilus assembly protein PilC